MYCSHSNSCRSKSLCGQCGWLTSSFVKRGTRYLTYVLLLFCLIFAQHLCWLNVSEKYFSCKICKGYYQFKRGDTCHTKALLVEVPSYKGRMVKSWHVSLQYPCYTVEQTDHRQNDEKDFVMYSRYDCAVLILPWLGRAFHMFHMLVSAVCIQNLWIYLQHWPCRWIISPTVMTSVSG